MADTLSVSLEGLNDILADLRAAEEHILAGTQEAFESALQLIYDDSQASVPVDTGALKASGVLEIGKFEGSVSYGNEQVDYQWYVELGTRKQAAQPYLFPAYVRGVAQLKQDLGLTGI